MIFGYYLFNKYLFWQIVEVVEGGLIVRKKRYYSWDDILVVKREDQWWHYLFGPIGFTIFFKDGKSLRIIGWIHKKGNFHNYFFKTRDYDELRNIVINKAKNKEWKGPDEYITFWIVGSIIELPFLIITLIILKMGMDSPIWMIYLLIDAFLACFATLIVVIIGRRKYLRRLLNKEK